MRKRKLLLLVLLCSMLAACKNDEVTETGSAETEIAGVEVVEEESLYNYSYEEQSGGTLLFSIEGSWSEKQSWVLNADKEAVADVKELSQDQKEVKYQFLPQEKNGGYSDFKIYLCDDETKEMIYSCTLSLMLSEDGKGLSMINAYFEEPLKEEESTEEGNMEEEPAEEENTEEEFTEEERMAIEASAENFHKLAGELSFPKEFTSLHKEVQTYELSDEETTVGFVSFIYKEYEYSCLISPDIPLSTFKEKFGIGDEQWKVRMINEVEVSYYEEQDSRSIMWKNPEGHRYVLLEKQVTGETGFEVVELLMKQ